MAIGFIFLGSLFQNDLVWNLADFFNNLMVIPNVIALVALSGLVVANTKFGKKECCCCKKDETATEEVAE